MRRRELEQAIVLACTEANLDEVFVFGGAVESASCNPSAHGRDS